MVPPDARAFLGAPFYAVYESPPDCPDRYAIVGWEPRIGGSPRLLSTAYGPTFESKMREHIPDPDDYAWHLPTDNDRREVPNLVGVWRRKDTAT